MGFGDGMQMGSTTFHILDNSSYFTLDVDGKTRVESLISPNNPAQPKLLYISLVLNVVHNYRYTR